MFFCDFNIPLHYSTSVFLLFCIFNNVYLNSLLEVNSIYCTVIYLGLAMMQESWTHFYNITSSNSNSYFCNYKQIHTFIHT